MGNIVAISQENHRHKTWNAPGNFAFAERDAVLFLGASEISRMAVRLPLAFLRHENAVRLIMMVGLEPGQNLIVGPDGSWQETYLPVALRSYPFCLAPGPTGDLILCFNETYGLINDGPSGHPFFQFDGSLAPQVKQVMDLLVAYEREKLACDQVCAALDAAGLIKPWELMVPGPSGARRVEGLHTIDEARLEALDDETFLALRKAGGITVAYCQMLSTQNLAGLIQRAQTRPPPPTFAASAPMELDFSRFGG